MFITNFMTTPVKTVRPETTLAEARQLMVAGSFRHLPVTAADSTLLGMITDRDLRSALPSGTMAANESAGFLEHQAEMTVAPIMTEVVTRLPATATLDDALLLFERHKVGALPVVDEANRLVGILSINDLLKAYKELFGLGVRGSSLIAVEDDGKPQALTRLTGVLESKDITFTRLIRAGETAPGSGRSVIYIRIHSYNLGAISHALAEAGFRPVIPGR